MEWQPIETAPKDGTEFLGAEYLGVFKSWIRQSTKFKDGRFVVSWDDDDDFEPTVWHPLPSPPEAPK